MQNTVITNKITPLHTQYNFNQYVNTRIKKITKQGNTSRLLIIGLIIWNLVISINYFKPDTTIPQFTDKQNKEIMIEEFIPPYDLSPIDVKELR